MAGENEKWSDLAVRLSSGAVMVLLGLYGVWAGGHFFHGMIAVICGLMVWELVRMFEPDNRAIAIQLGLLSGVAAGTAIYLPPGFALPILLAPALVGFGQLKRYRVIFMVFTGMVLLAGFGMMSVRDGMGFQWMLWLVLVVVATDVVGYFAGRMIGGPKFWPRVSPKKTWAGTAFGWLGAGIIGAYFAATTPVGWQLIGFSIAVSMASQMGDIAESAVKRRVGVKDSSNLIPGHGGLLDRFDGMLGASVFLLIAGPLFAVPFGVS
ncbi:MAG: phosphatidate cytidylyltransferase [Pseudomonadota bacterium]